MDEPDAPTAPAEPQTRRALLPALARTAGVTLLGLPVGVLWAGLAPRPDVVVTAAGLDFVDSQTKDFIAADGLLFVLGVTAGVLVGLAGWRVGRDRPLGTLLGLTLGGVLAGFVAARTGALLAGRPPASAAAPLGSVRDLPLRLHAYAVLLGWPAAAVLTFTLLALRRPQALPDGPGRRISAD